MWTRIGEDIEASHQEPPFIQRQAFRFDACVAGRDEVGRILAPPAFLFAANDSTERVVADLRDVDVETLGGPRNVGARGTVARAFALGLALIAPMVDALVRPEVMMRAIDEGVIEVRGHPAHQRSGDAPVDRTDRAGRGWNVEREGADRVIVSRRDAHQHGASAVAAVLERRGFAKWRLTGLRLAER